MRIPVLSCHFPLATALLFVSGATAQPGPLARGPGLGSQGAPHLLLDRLSRMTPQERDRILERLPPERRERVQERLQRLDNLSPEARERLRREYSEFQQLPPEQRQQIRELFRQFSDVPPDRRHELRRELSRLRRMPAERRANRIASESFTSEYNEQEREMLGRLANELPALKAPAWRDSRSQRQAGGSARQQRRGRQNHAN